ncbi:replication factor c subunit [Aphelenchoides avenae]|nr:replication factor c subunit [Aphelenchus avenae]
MDEENIDPKNLPWVEKYRPASLEDLVSHQEIIKTINRLIDENKLPHLLFYGPPGTGKTSTILAAARRIFTEKQRPSMVLELNASDDRGIGVVRDEIVSFCQSRTLHVDHAGTAQFKLVILDEADAMTKDAQNALRRVIEKYTDNVRFCIICNYLSKIIPAVQSRCTRFRFAPLSKEQVMPRLEYIVKEEKVTVTEDGKEALYKLSGGDMRRVLNILQSTALALGEVNADSVYQCVGQPQPVLMDKIFRLLLDSSIKDAYEKLTSMTKEQGIAISDILENLLDRVMQVDIENETAARLLDKMAAIQVRLASGTSEKIQLLAMVSSFVTAREEIFAHKKGVSDDVMQID